MKTIKFTKLNVVKAVTLQALISRLIVFKNKSCLGDIVISLKKIESRKTWCTPEHTLHWGVRAKTGDSISG
jgi:hypothetical protein